MKSIYLFLITLFLLQAQHELLLQSNEVRTNIKSPKEFLGYEIGDYYTQHHDVMMYINYLNSVASDRSVFINYGKTNQHRDLNLLVISSKENIANLEAIKAENLKIANGQKSNLDIPAIVWFGFNVHGNETSSSEAAMITAYHFLAGTTSDVTMMLEKAVIVIDPMLNPDGRERYINWFKNTVGQKPNSDPNSAEHNEPWPGGRSNHYMFDLNRDWAFASQIETKQRLLVYHQFKPHVFVDFHEMGYNSGYFFFPAVKPINPILPNTTVKWGKIFGEGNGEMLDRFGSLFYTAEHFDLFYPGYGDSYPSMNGSIGMTYEQSGHSRSGKTVTRNDGSVLTLRERAYNHYKTAIATTMTAVTRKNELITDFKNFFSSALKRGQNDAHDYYVIDQKGNYRELVKLLTLHDIKIEYIKTSSKIKLENGKNYTTSVDQAIVPIDQAQYVLLRNLFDDQISIPDTAFYDLSSWSIPRAFNVDVYRTSSDLITQQSRSTNGKKMIEQAKIGYVFTPENIHSYQFLSSLQSAGISMRVFTSTVSNSGMKIVPGSVFISVKRNMGISNLHELISKEANRFEIDVFALDKGMSDEGIDLGSNSITPLKNVRLAILTGESLSSLNVGALWYLFDQKLEIQATMLNIDNISRLDLDNYTTLVIPGDWGGGSSINRALGERGVEKLSDWVQKGGHIIGLDNGAKFMTDQVSKLTSVKVKEMERDEVKDNEIIDIPYNKRDEYYNKRSFPGAFFPVVLDLTHPLTVGVQNPFYVLKTNRTAFETNSSFFNIGKFNGKRSVLGYASETDVKHFDKTAFLLHQSMGNGSITVMNADPVYRAFTYGTTQLFLNCVFLGNARF